MPDSVLPDQDASGAGGPVTSTQVVTPSADHVEREFTVAERSQSQLVLRRFLQHRLAVVSIVVLLLIILFAYVGAALWKYGADTITGDNSKPPSFDHPFGTDAVGKDQLAQVMRGTQISLQISVMVAVFATFIGTVWGAVAGFYRGWVDSVMMRISDLVLTLPLLAVAAVLGHTAGGTWWLIAVVIAGLYWAYVSRVARGVVLSLREKEFVEASKALGASNARIIFRHLVPNALGSVIVNLTILVAISILLDQTKQIVTADAKVVGLPDLRAGQVVQISHLGARLDGKYLVTKTTHVIDDNGYITSFSCRREQYKGGGTP